MNKTMNYMLLAVLMLGMGSAFTSCKDDELTEEEKQQQQEQEADEKYLLKSDFWQVVGQLSNAQVLPDDWQNATFEPGIGQPSDKSATTRIVLTNAAEAAAESFANLTDADVTGLDSYEWKRNFGTLTYERLHDGTGWAAVDVDIKQMPGLKRIIYCTPEQQGLNASVPGTPYYRFGDVVKKLNADNIWEYWVCVRPCFGEEGKGDMHWMCLGSLPESNIATYIYTTDNRQWWWPVSMTTNDEHIKNLAEMTYAILHPTAWEEHYLNNPKAYHFHDFSRESISYHDHNFWNMVQYAWSTKIDGEGKTVWELLFHRTMEQVMTDGQLNFFYGSGSGPNMFSWNLNMKTASLNLRAQNNYFNPREIVKKSHKKSCNTHAFDIHEYSQYGKALTSSYFDNSDMYIYPLRYASGEQLAGFQPGYYQSLHNVNRIQNVYVFNEYYKQNVGSKYNMKAFKEGNKKAFKGRGIFFQGDVVRDQNGNTWICAQDAKNNLDPSYTSDYAYFISFDKNALGATPAAGPVSDFENLPSRNLAIQMMWVLETMIHNATTNTVVGASDASTSYSQVKNIKSYAGFDMMFLYPCRDTLHAYNDKPNDPKFVPCTFTSALYRTDDNKIGIVRLIGDYTASQSMAGSRDWSWRIYDSYTKDLKTNPRKMLLSDLRNKSYITQYNSDRWVSLRWKIFEIDVNGNSISDSKGPRTEPLFSDDLSLWLLAKQTPLAFMKAEETVKNMYNEPVMAFAVKRVLDTPGVYPAYKFEDGTTFTPLSLLKDVDSINFCNDVSLPFIGAFGIYKDANIFINDVPDASFGLNNTK